MTTSIAPVPIVLLLGPTASGKTAAALALAKHFPIEIVSIDSACVYRGLDAGTAKPSAVERQAVAHHLIDCTEPWNPYSAARFVNDATAAIGAIRSRGNIPLLVGGTMLYAHALMHGLDELPTANEALRAKLEALAAQIGWPAMHERLAVIDPATAQRLAPRDAQRISRALEIYELTGKPMSQLFAKRGDTATNLWRVISLEPSDRTQLHERISIRFQAMLASGLIEEVEQLRNEPKIHAQLPAMRCVGYRQAWDMLEGKLARSELTMRGIVATRQLAKRQLTWLRSMPRTVLDCTANTSSVPAELRPVFERLLQP